MLIQKKILLGLFLASISMSVVSAEVNPNSTGDVAAEEIDLGKCGKTDRVHAEQRCSEQPAKIENEDLSNVVSKLGKLYYYRNGSTVGKLVHTGLDLAAISSEYNFELTQNGEIPEGKKPLYIQSASDGFIVATKHYDDIHTNPERTKYGNFYLIKHPKAGKDNKDVYTLYLHMSDPNNEFSKLEVGSIVKKGQRIGVMYKGGESANEVAHLHYAIQYISDLGDGDYYRGMYPSLNKVYKAGEDKSGTIKGVEYDDVLNYFKEIYEDPETFKFNHTPTLQSDLPYVIAKELETVNLTYGKLDAEMCTSIWNDNISSSVASVDNSRNYQAKAVDQDCVYKKNDEGVIIRFNTLVKKSFLYDYSEEAGYHFSSPETSGAYSASEDDKMREIYNKYLTLFNKTTDPLFSQQDLNLVKTRLLNKGGNIDECVLTWNTESTSSLTASSADLSADVYVDSDGQNCTFISVNSYDYIYYNYNENSYVLGNQKPMRDKLLIRYKMERKFKENLHPIKGGCESAISDYALPACKFIEKHGIFPMSYFFALHHRNNRMPEFFYYQTEFKGEIKYVYLSTDGQYAIVYKPDMSSFEVVLDTDFLYSKLNNFNYSVEEYAEKMKFLVNITDRKKNFLNFREVNFTANNTVQCQPYYIGQENKWSCINPKNQVIDLPKECESIWFATFNHPSSIDGFESKLTENNVCHFNKVNDGKTIVYDAEKGEVTLLEIESSDDVVDRFIENTTLANKDPDFRKQLGIGNVLWHTTMGASLRDTTRKYGQILSLEGCKIFFEDITKSTLDEIGYEVRYPQTNNFCHYKEKNGNKYFSYFKAPYNSLFKVIKGDYSNLDWREIDFANVTNYKEDISNENFKRYPFDFYIKEVEVKTPHSNQSDEYTNRTMRLTKLINSRYPKLTGKVFPGNGASSIFHFPKEVKKVEVDLAYYCSGSEVSYNLSYRSNKLDRLYIGLHENNGNLICKKGERGEIESTITMDIPFGGNTINFTQYNVHISKIRYAYGYFNTKKTGQKPVFIFYKVLPLHKNTLKVALNSDFFF